MVKYLAQGHKHHSRGSNPHSDYSDIRTQIRCTKPLGNILYVNSFLTSNQLEKDTDQLVGPIKKKQWQSLQGMGQSLILTFRLRFPSLEGSIIQESIKRCYLNEELCFLDVCNQWNLFINSHTTCSVTTGDKR